MKVKYTFYKNRKNKYFLTYCEVLEQADENDNILNLPSYIEVLEGDQTKKYTYGIYSSAFYGVNKIVELHIPSSITEIQDYAFERSSIKKFYFYSNLPPSITTYAFDKINETSDIIIYSPNGYRALYLHATQNKFTVENGNYGSSAGMNSIPPLAYYNTPSLEKYHIDVSTKRSGLMPFLRTSGTLQLTSDSDVLITPAADDDSSLYYQSDEGLELLKLDKDSQLQSDLVTIKPNALYNNNAYNNSNQPIRAANVLEQLSFQNAQIRKLIIDENTEHISQYALLNAKINSIELNENNKKFKILTSPEKDILKDVINNIDLCILDNRIAPSLLMRSRTTKDIENLSWEKINDIIATSSAISAYYFKNYQFQYEYINIPPSVKRIERGAFEGASGILGINIEDRTEPLIIENEAFYNINKDSPNIDEIIVSIPNSNITIGSQAFAGNSFINFAIREQDEGKKLQILNNSFVKFGTNNMIGVKNIHFQSKNTYEAYKNDENWQTIFNNAAIYCGQDKYVMVPYGTTEINDRSGYIGNNELDTILIPNSVTYINYRTFGECRNLRNVIFLNPQGADQTLNLKFNSQAFYRCSGLYSIELPSRTNEIAGDAFKECDKLIEVKTNNLLKTFQLNNIFPNRILAEKPEGFLKTYLNGKGVKTIYFNWEPNCTISFNKRGYYIYNSKTGNYDALKLDTYFQNGESVIVYQEGEKYLKDLNKCQAIFPSPKEKKAGLIDQELSEQYHIFDLCLANNNNLIKITLPKNIKTLGQKAFASCSNLQEIYYDTIQAEKLFRNNNKICSSLFESSGYGSNTGIELTIGSNCRVIGANMFAPDWQHGRAQEHMKLRRIIFENMENKKDEQVFLGINSFRDLPRLLEVNFPRYFSLGTHAFASCHSLLSIRVYNFNSFSEQEIKQLKSECEQALTWCKIKFDNIQHSSQVAFKTGTQKTLINDQGFEFYHFKDKYYLIDQKPPKDLLDTFSLPLPTDTIKTYTITQYAFYKNPHIKHLVCEKRDGNAYITIEDNAFRNSAVETIKIEKGYLTGTVGRYSFSYCVNLNEVDLSTSTIGEGKGKEIAPGMFAHCGKLAKISLPNQLNGFGTDALINCNLLLELNIPSTVTYASGSSLRIGSSNNKAIFYLNRTEDDGARMTIQPSTFNTTWIDKIIVPHGEKEFYTANDATNWVALSDLGLIQEAEI